MNEKIIESWESFVPDILSKFSGKELIKELAFHTEQAISSARAEERAIYENCPQCEGLGKKMVAEERTRIMEVAKKMKMKYTDADTLRTECITDGYNAAIEDFITALAQEKEAI